jgi:hypothetical protein
MESKISISFPYESKEEFEERQKKIIRDIFEEKLLLLDQNKSTNEYGTRKQVASKLHISLPTLNELTKTGLLKGYRMQGRVLYKWPEVDKALAPIGALKYKRGQ